MTRTLVTPDIEEFMLCSDWLTAQECLWDFRTGMNRHQQTSRYARFKKKTASMSAPFCRRECCDTSSKRNCGAGTHDTCHSAHLHGDRNGGSTNDPIWSLLRAHNAAPMASRNGSSHREYHGQARNVDKRHFLGQVIPVEIVSSEEDRSVPMKPSKPHRSYDPNSNTRCVQDSSRQRGY